MIELLLEIKEFLSSPPGIAIMAVLVSWAMKKLFLAKPAWVAYEGTIIAAIRYAERTFKDRESGSVSGYKLSKALSYVLRVYAERNPRHPSPSAKVKAQFEEGIQLVHSDQEASERT